MDVNRSSLLYKPGMGAWLCVCVCVSVCVSVCVCVCVSLRREEAFKKTGRFSDPQV